MRRALERFAILAIVVAAALLLGAAASRRAEPGRYTLVASPHEASPTLYVMDTWTGEVKLVGTQLGMKFEDMAVRPGR